MSERLINVILPGRSSGSRWDLGFQASKITSISKIDASSKADSGNASLVLPTLCHPHVHLDKAYLLTSHALDSKLPDYSDLAPQEGSFTEALAFTSKAKGRYTLDDLVHRGAQLIAASIEAGVTSMRAFVEVDNVTKHLCVEAGVKLKHKFASLCDVQLCVFAQDPVFNLEKGHKDNRGLVEDALVKFEGDVEVLGSTPYVEGEDSLQAKNIEWAVRLAKKHSVHLDFHLDYNLDESATPMVWKVIESVKSAGWSRKEQSHKTVVIGHCTRTTLFSESEMRELADKIGSLPIHFVGLPTSDLFMMGRPGEDASQTGHRPRGTMQVLDMHQSFGLDVCMGINNVGNAFTPWGSADPLKLASLGIGLYQAGTKEDARLLYECVSSRARQAIGKGQAAGHSEWEVHEGDGRSLLVMEQRKDVKLNDLISVPCRKYFEIADVVWDPPEIAARRVINRQ